MTEFVYAINADLCVECGQCRRFCPIAGAIVLGDDYQHRVVADTCSGCGLCEAFCPVPDALYKQPFAPAQSPERSKTLRRVVWRGKWHYHEHPIMAQVTLDARRQLRAQHQAERRVLSGVIDS